MEFLGASFLWALPLVAVPIVLHLLSRRRRQVVRWGAMRFLLEAVPRRRRRWRIEDLLLMALRAGLVAAAVLAFAQPRVNLGRWLSKGSRDVVLVLDTSLSTAVSGPGGPVFDAQRKAAEDLVSRLDEGDHVRVLLASTPPEWMIREPIELRGEARQQLASRLHGLKPNLGSADMRRCIQQALDAEDAEKAASRLVVSFGDDQARSWDAQAIRAWEAVKSRAAAADTSAAVHVCLTRHDGPVLNRAVDSLTTMRTTVHVGDPAVLTAVVRNTGDGKTAAGVAKLRIAGAEAATAAVSTLNPGQTTQVALSHTFEAAGVYRCSVELDGSDDLPLDDQGQVVIEVVEQVPILVAQGVPGPSPMEGDAQFLLTALGEGRSDDGGSASVFRATVVPAFDLNADMVRRYPCIVLLNVSTLATETIKALQDYVRGGGGVWIIAGDRTDPQSFNSILFADGRGLSPAALGKKVGDPQQRTRYERLRPPPANHPATRLLADLERLDLDQVRVYARFQFDRLSEQTKAATLLATSEGEPMAIEKQVGQGRLILQAMPVDMSWSNLPICQAFVVMAHEWLWYLAEPMQTRWNVAPGDTFATSIPADVALATAEVSTPGGERLKLASTERDGRRTFRYGKTLWPGAYQLVLTDSQGGERGVPFQVSRDPKESELTGLTAADVQALVDHGGLQFEGDPLATKSRGRPSPPEPVWTWLILAGLAALLAESLLGGYLARRRAPAPATAAIESMTAAA